MNLVGGNADYYNAVSAADVLLRDGSGMAILFRRLGLEPGLNMNGTTYPQITGCVEGTACGFLGLKSPFCQCGAA